MWEYYDNGWKSYDESTALKLSGAFLNNKKDVKFRIGMGAFYLVDFEFMIQQNISTSFIRPVRTSLRIEESKTKEKLLSLSQYSRVLLSEEDSREYNCPICIDTYSEDTELPVIKMKYCENHYYHEDCLLSFYQNSKGDYIECAICSKIYGIRCGNMPYGTMQVREIDSKCQGEHVNSIEIIYSFPSGIQSENHPNPGARYSGTVRHCYIPNTEEGRNLVKLLRISFERRLTFTIGTSITTGNSNTVIWNGIHHKTSLDSYGGYGYPDPTYFERVLCELSTKGVYPN